MLVSFIIPAYNAADTIVRCLDSIYGLSLKREEFEVIVVDDCSTDNTCEIVEQYAQQLANNIMSRADALNEPLALNDVCNLTLLRQPENHRQGAARNRGVSVAKGEYICFVDADDAVTEGIESAIRMAIEKNVDMVALHYMEKNEYEGWSKDGDRLDFSDEDIFTGIELQSRYPYWCSVPWVYICKKEFLRNADYPFAEDVLYEDSDFVMAHLIKAKRMAYSPICGYIAYTRQGSTTHSMSHHNLADYLFLGTRMLKIYESADKSIADSILHGACHNVSKALKSLYKLGSIAEVRAFYKRVDKSVDRKKLCNDRRIHTYLWSTWNSICLKHKGIAILLLSCVMPIYRIVKR